MYRTNDEPSAKRQPPLITSTDKRSGTQFTDRELYIQRILQRTTYKGFIINNVQTHIHNPLNNLMSVCFML